MKRIIADVESIRNDQLTQKELDLIKQEEADAFFKKTANDYFNKLREMDEQLKRGKINKVFVILYWIKSLMTLFL